MGRTGGRGFHVTNSAALDKYRAQLHGLAAQSRLRTLEPRSGIDFASNDYLGLATSKRLADAVMKALREAGVEFRRGTSGGGNQLRQPYLRRIVGDEAWKKYPKVDHVHFFGMYIGNYPDLERERILELCELLNKVRA